MKTAQKVVFFTKNTGRKKDFLLDTRVLSTEKKGYVVEKHAASKKAIAHVQALCSSYESLAKIQTLARVVSIVPARQVSDDVVQFPYVKGRSAERVLLDLILSGQRSQALAMIEKLFSVIDAFPSTTVDPTASSEYIAVFGNSFSQIQECITPGIIDLNLDNFIIDAENRWHLFDYEWLFDFPVPKDFLKTRMLWYFFVRHKEVLAYHHVSLGGGKTVATKVFIPNFIYDAFAPIITASIPAFLATEAALQQYVTVASQEKSHETDTLNEPIISEDTKPLVGIEQFVQSSVQTKTKQLTADIAAREKKIKALSDQLRAIESSKTYRLSRSLSKLNPKRFIKTT